MKFKDFWRSLKDWFTDFTEHSTIHGVIYIGDDHRSWFERIFWIVGLGLSILCCGKLIGDATHINPVIITFDNYPTPIWQIPFPAVTICPKVFAASRHTSMIDKYYYYNSNFQPWQYTDDEKKKILALTQVCTSLRASAYDIFTENDTCNDCLDTLREIRIPPEEMFVECVFQNQAVNCSSIFQELVLGFALCYTFNGLEYHRRSHREKYGRLTPNWSIDDGYNPSVTWDTYPRRALDASQKFGLSITLKMNRNDYGFSCLEEPGVWIEVHTSGDSPQFESKFLNPTSGDSLTLSLKPNVLKTSKDLREYSIADRKCYFSDERHLEYFKHYTRSLCELNCKLIWFRRHCGCWHLLMAKYRNEVDICGPKHVRCTSYYFTYLSSIDYSVCDCLPACTSIAFESEVTMNEFNMSVYPEEQRKGFEYSRYNIYFKQNHFLASQRKLAYGMTEFLANCGGILGLCLGVSVISLLEVFYYCTIRLWCKVFKDEDSSTIIFVEDLRSSPSVKKRNLLATFKDLVKDFSSNTTIQGANYIADCKSSRIERVCWALIVILSLLCCGSLISETFQKYSDTPLIITYANEETHIKQIPFPAVTVCPQTISKEFQFYYDYFKVKNKSLYDLEEYRYDTIIAMSQLCDPDLFADIDPANETDCKACHWFLEYFIEEMSNTLFNCYYFKDDTCETMFAITYTERGACYTFNSLQVDRSDEYDMGFPTNNWTLDGGYPVDIEDDEDFFYTVPRAATLLRMNVFLTSYNSVTGLCKGPNNGFNVYLHLPNEAPNMEKHYYFVPFEQMLQIIITPRMIKTGQELREFSTDKRQCYFNDERYLRFFRYYTQNNCEIECVANLTVTKCGCQRFHMPEIRGVKLCGISDIRCYQAAFHEMSNNQNISAACNCLPACTTISYDAEINKISMKNTLDFIEREDPGYLSYMNVAKLKLMFGDYQFVALKRVQLYGNTEFLANCGGLLGLFLGFSLMSVLEFFYFCVIRMVCEVKKHAF